jgi:hypothetical protein
MRDTLKRAVEEAERMPDLVHVYPGYKPGSDAFEWWRSEMMQWLAAQPACYELAMEQLFRRLYETGAIVILDGDGGMWRGAGPGKSSAMTKGAIRRFRLNAALAAKEVNRAANKARSAANGFKANYSKPEQLSFYPSSQSPAETRAMIFGWAQNVSVISPSTLDRLRRQFVRDGLVLVVEGKYRRTPAGDMQCATQPQYHPIDL